MSSCLMSIILSTTFKPIMQIASKLNVVILNAVILNVIILNVVMLNVVILNVMALIFSAPRRNRR
jgi:hypothetical protein